MFVAKGKRGAMDPVGLAVFIILIMAVTYPVAKNVIDNQSLSGTDALLAGTALTLIIVLVVVKIAKGFGGKRV
jgi:hypothetical protein